MFAQPLFTAVAYDATLQGGLFNTKSPYTITANDIERFTAQIHYGIILQTRTVFFEYFRGEITREFASGDHAKWGGIKFGFKF